jgi:wyosine [tRNA(Phe)-imidazoG37] synthetase (radical SAM superfamily)
MAKVLGLQKGIIYGPVNSRRLGRSLGINLMPTSYKLCSFNCVYCHYGWTKYLKTDMSEHIGNLPDPGQVEIALDSALKTTSPPPEYITFSGNGEPTLHPDFGAIVDVVAAVRKRSGVDARMAVLSNSTGASLKEVREGLAKLDMRIMKLDAGTQAGLDAVNRPAGGILLDAIVADLKRLEDVTLQCFFADGEVCNTSDEDVENWLSRVEEIEPVFVQVYSIENPPAMSTLVGVPREKLQSIVEKVRQRGIEAAAY